MIIYFDDSKPQILWWLSCIKEYWFNVKPRWNSCGLWLRKSTLLDVLMV